MSEDQTTFDAAYAKIATAPLDLTTDDFARLEAMSPTLARTAREALRVAQLAVVQAHTPALRTKAAAPADRSQRPVTRKQLARFADQFSDVLVDILKKTVVPLREQVKALDARLAAIEGKPHVKFTGTFKPGETYAPGDAVVHHGGLWICKAETCGEPSKDFAGWTLAVKSRSIA